MKVKYPECPNCQRVIVGPARYCPFCGGNQVELAEIFANLKAPVQSTLPAQPAAASPKTASKPASDSQKPKSRKPLFVGLAVVGLIVIAASIGGQDSKTTPSTQATAAPTSAAASPEENEPVVVIFSEVAETEVVAERASQTCSALEKVVVPDNNASFFPSRGAIVIDEVARIEKESTAKKYVSENKSWINDDFLEGYRDTLRAAVQSELEGAISDLGYVGAEYELDMDEWSTGFLNESITTCELSEQRQQIEGEINNFQDNVNRVIKLSK